MKYFIIGASGLIGSNCLQYLIESGREAIGTHLNYPTERTVYFNSNILSNPSNYLVEQYSPDVIVHCGALTNVDYCELNEEESYEKTVHSAINSVALSKKVDAQLIYVSTDYVFNGTEGPYTESAVVNPINIYGRHKLAAENYILEHLDNALIVRVTNVYGNEARNKNFVARIIQNIINGNLIKIKLPIDQYATPINAWDIARAISVLAEQRTSGLYHLGSTDYYNRAQLFKKVTNYFNYNNYELELFSTKELKQPAKRPLLGGLLAVKFLQENPQFAFTNVDDYLKSLINGSFNDI